MTGAYYNEHDRFAAEWLRNLIKAGLIADGEVDERSIEQVEPTDLKGFTQCHFFAGIGVWSCALRAAGWADDSPVWTGSCPCQSFSASGKRGGFSDKRHLWPSWFRLIEKCCPDVCFGEQVASKDGLAWLDVVSADLEGKGYAIGATDLCAAGFGAPHIRQRLYWVAESSRQQNQPPTASRFYADARRGRTNDGMANSEDSNGRRSDETHNRGRRIEEVGRPGDGGRMAESASGRAKRSGTQRHERPIQDGYWAGNEWVSTSDGRKFPIKPGLCVLAHGTPARVGRLRGYGNAIVAPVAQGFIEAYLTSISESAGTPDFRDTTK